MEPRDANDWYEPDTTWWQQQDDELRQFDNWNFTDKETDHDRESRQLEF